MDLMTNDELSAIFRPTGLQIDWKHLIITVLTPSGLPLIVPNQLVMRLGTSTEERISNLNDYLFVTFQKKKDYLQCSQLIPLRGTVDVEIAGKLLAKSKYNPIELLLIGLGYKPTKEVARLFTPRILTYFRGFDGKPLHVAQFTLPETAKTNFGIRSETLFNWKYIPEPPTLARLILDARQGILGEVFLRNGIVFDEFDKWVVDTQDRRATFDSILTGMEQGKWERGVSSQGIRVPDVPRLIPLMFFGNLGDFTKLRGIMDLCTRAWFVNIFTVRLRHDVSALADRLAVIDICFEKIPIMDYLTHTVLPDSVIRGIIKLLQAKVTKCDVSQLKGRLRRHSNNVYSIMNTFTKIEPETADAIVSGTFDWDALIREEPEASEMFPERDQTYPSYPEE